MIESFCAVFFFPLGAGIICPIFPTDADRWIVRAAAPEGSSCDDEADLETRGDGASLGP
jgi:hypothetical protein